MSGALHLLHGSHRCSHLLRLPRLHCEPVATAVRDRQYARGLAPVGGAQDSNIEQQALVSASKARHEMQANDQQMDTRSTHVCIRERTGSLKVWGGQTQRTERAV